MSSRRTIENYRKPDRLTRPMSLLVGNGLFTSDGDFWLRQRRLMQPAFHRQQLAKLVPLMVAAAESFVREQQTAGPGQVVDMLNEMMKLALRIASTTLFSTDITGEADEIGRAYRIGFEYVSRRMRSRAPHPNLAADASQPCVRQGQAAPRPRGAQPDRVPPPGHVPARRPAVAVARGPRRGNGHRHDRPASERRGPHAAAGGP